MVFDQLPVDLVAEVLGNLDLHDLINASYASKRLRAVASDPSLNPWRRPILANLRSQNYETALKHLSVRTTVPRQNWVDILVSAKPTFILFEATLPNLRSTEWEECYRRRFLPGWSKYKRDASWKETFIKILHRVWHRSVSSCTTDEAWTKYIVLNRNGSANELEVSSRNHNPLAVFNELKLQNNLSHLDTQIRVVLELADVRVLAKPRSHLMVNPNAHIFLNPPGIDAEDDFRTFSKVAPGPSGSADHGVYPMSSSTYVPTFLVHEYTMPSVSYRRLTHPQPAHSHRNYPFFTPSGRDVRWAGQPEVEEQGLHWVGSLMIVAQIIKPALEDESPGHAHQQYSSFCWTDLWTIAPWLEERISKRIDGAGLGN